MTSTSGKSSADWYTDLMNDLDNVDPNATNERRNVDVEDGPASRLEESDNPSINAESAIKNSSYRTRSVKNAFLGEMISFKYFPKGAKTLPYWDAVPLIILFAKYKDGFLGMNIHYMPKKGRQQLIDNVKKGRRAKKKNMGMMAQLLKNPRHGFLWKRYLFSQIKSRVISVPESEWDYIVDLPVQFKKASHQKVYSDYRRFRKK